MARTKDFGKRDNLGAISLLYVLVIVIGLIIVGGIGFGIGKGRGGKGSTREGAVTPSKITQPNDGVSITIDGQGYLGENGSRLSAGEMDSYLERIGNGGGVIKLIRKGDATPELEEQLLEVLRDKGIAFEMRDSF